MQRGMVGLAVGKLNGERAFGAGLKSYEVRPSLGLLLLNHQFFGGQTTWCPGLNLAAHSEYARPRAA